MKLTRQSISEDLELGARVFERLLKSRQKQLYDNAFLLTMDYAFKESITVVDNKSLHSIVINIRDRIGADLITLVSLDYEIMCDTLDKSLVDEEYYFPELIEEVEEFGEASSIVMRHDKYYQLVVVPILAPDPIAWLTVGFQIDKETVEDLKTLVMSQVTIVNLNKNGKWHIVASTLPETLVKSMGDNLRSNEFGEGKSLSIIMSDDEYVSLFKMIEKNDNFFLYALLQRSMSVALAPYYKFRKILLLITLTALIISFALAFMISKTVTTPVRTLVKGVERIENGNFEYKVNIRQRDEMGKLAGAFNRMMQSLMEKNRVQDLLGKVVSTPIARELLSKKLELGGEEREVTILFSDMRNFTTLSENRSPTTVLNLLNIYLTKMSDIIEENGGVIDKYIGDAIMALFGAPLEHKNDVDRALNAALEMIKAKDAINMEFENQGLPQIDIGIGINTDVVVAGNMGSTNRLNYTVIGDGVNLASRLEGLTKDKKYNTKIIISEEVYQKASKKFITKFLGDVAVKGKQQLVSIYALLAKEDEFGNIT